MSVLSYLPSPLIKMVNGYLNADVDFLCNEGKFIFNHIHLHGSLYMNCGDGNHISKQKICISFQNIMSGYGNEIKSVIMYMIDCNWHTQINYLAVLQPSILLIDRREYIERSIDSYYEQYIEKRTLFNENTGLYTSLNTFKNVICAIGEKEKNVLFEEIFNYAVKHNDRALLNILQWKVFSSETIASLLMHNIMALTEDECSRIFRIAHDHYTNFEYIRNNVRYFIAMAYNCESYDPLRQMARFDMLTEEHTSFMDEKIKNELLAIRKKCIHSTSRSWSS